MMQNRGDVWLVSWEEWSIVCDVDRVWATAIVRGGEGGVNVAGCSVRDEKSGKE